MNKSKFDNAPLKEKVYQILEKGKPITNRQFLHFNIRLYGLNDFFAEIWYIPAVNKIDRVETLTTDEVLHMYKRFFDISDLLK
ncbi:MAG: hypothetical protein R6U62_01980 [Bacteroidales bacterium]